MGNSAIPTRPLSGQEKLLRRKFYENIAAQTDLMDRLSERLLTLQLAIPGIYATVLKLVYGESATLTIGPALYLTFAFWLVALLLTLAAMIPRKWTVDPDLLKQDPDRFSEGLGIEDFFNQTALYKRRLLIASSLLFFGGIISAVFTLG